MMNAKTKALKMSRKDALNHIKIAASTGDLKGATRLYVEHRISRDAYKKAWQSGLPK